MAASPGIDLRRLYWVGPATVAASVLAVLVVQKISLAMLRPLPKFSEAVLNSNEPAAVTATLVSAAVLTFAIVAVLSESPSRTFVRVASLVLLVSFTPNVALALSGNPGVDWPSMMALMVMHVVAWAVTVSMLTRLGVSRVPASQFNDE